MLAGYIARIWFLGAFSTVLAAYFELPLLGLIGLLISTLSLIVYGVLGIRHFYIIKRKNIRSSEEFFRFLAQ